MQEQLYTLNTQIENLPSTNSCRACSDLTGILQKYKRILDKVNCYNEEFKSTTAIYYADISNIMDNIDYSLYARSNFEKRTAFENARKELKADILALAALIQPAEELVTA